jgi:hypothetical protein
MRLIVGWAGFALFYLGGILAVVVVVWYFARLTRAGLRPADVPGLVKSAVGLVVLAAALAFVGMGLAVASLDSAPLVPLGLGTMVAGVWVAIYGARLLRMPAETDVRMQFKRLTSRALVLGQLVAVVGLITLVGAYLYLTGQRIVGLLLIGGPIAVNGVLLERLMDSLVWRPLLPKVAYRLLVVGGVVLALLALVMFLIP